MLLIFELYIMGYDSIPIKCTLTCARKLGKFLSEKYYDYIPKFVGRLTKRI